MIVKRKITTGKIGDDSYVVDRKKGVIRYKDPKTGAYIESKIQEGTVNIKPIKKSPNVEDKVKTYFRLRKDNYTKEGITQNLSTMSYRSSASSFK